MASEDDQDDIVTPVYEEREPLDALSIRQTTSATEQQALHMQRQQEFEDLLCQGVSVSNAIDICCKRWKVCPNYVTSVSEILSDRYAEIENTPNYRRKRRAQVRAMLEANLRRALDIGTERGISEATKIITELGKIDGVYEPEKVETAVNHYLAPLAFEDETAIATHITAVVKELTEGGPEGDGDTG